MRLDGRAADALRPISMQIDFLKTAPGSVLIGCGDTRVLCTATLEESVPPFLVGKGRGWLTAEYAMLPASTPVRKRRETGKQDGRSVEIQRLIGRSLRAVCDFEALGERCVHVDCDVLQADGGTRTAAITGAYVALKLAERAWISRETLPGPFVTDALAAVSCGVVNDVPLLDLCYAEDSRAQVDCNFVMTGAGNWVEVQATGEGRAFSRQEMRSLSDLAEKGILEFMRIQKEALA